MQNADIKIYPSQTTHCIAFLLIPFCKSYTVCFLSDIYLSIGTGRPSRFCLQNTQFGQIWNIHTRAKESRVRYSSVWFDVLEIACKDNGFRINNGLISMLDGRTFKWAVNFSRGLS